VNAIQLPLPLYRRTEQRLDDFIAHPQVVAHLQAMAMGIDQHNLYLYGPPGTGKTYLAQALCTTAAQAGHTTAGLSLSACRGELDQALQTLYDCRIATLDGLEALSGFPEDEISLFHFHNYARTHHITLLYTARAALDNLALHLADLRSRLAQCIQLSLDPLNESQRIQVLRARADKTGLTLDDASIHWLLQHHQRDLPGLLNLLERLDQESLASQRRITVPFLRQVLHLDYR